MNLNSLPCVFPNNEGLRHIEAQGSPVTQINLWGSSRVAWGGEISCFCTLKRVVICCIICLMNVAGQKQSDLLNYHKCP